MGLAPYGAPVYVDALRLLIHLKPGGQSEIDPSYCRHHAEGVSMTRKDGEPTMGPPYTKKLEDLLISARPPEEPLEPRHEGIVVSLQVVIAEASFHVLN